MASKLKQKKVTKLLEDSTLPDVYKKVILENLDKLREQQMDKAIKALEKEEVKLSKTEQALKRFEIVRKRAWKKLKKEQQKVADEFVAETVKVMVEAAKKERA